MAKNNERTLKLRGSMKSQLKPQLAPPMEPRLADAVRHLAQTGCPVLISGESGVGKTSISEWMHALSSQSSGECTTLASADFDPTSLASTISSHGTLILVEIADLPLVLQADLLRTYRQPASGPRRRLICTTSHDLSEATRQGLLREDFYSFISAVSLRIPPLRHREAELLRLADDLLERFALQYDRPKPQLSAEMCSFLLKHTWPGNFNELEVSMKTCVAIGDPDFSLAALRAASPAKKNPGVPSSRIPLKEATRAASIRIERQLIAESLRATDWNRKQTAKELKISYKTLLNKLKQSGISNDTASAKDRNPSLKKGAAVLSALSVLLLLLTAPCAFSQTSQRVQLAVFPSVQSSPVSATATSASVPAAATASPDVDPTTYVIGAEDALQITVWKEAQLSGPVTVRPDGMISLVLTGDVRAAGLTPMQLGADLAHRLHKFIQDPNVYVVVTAANSRRIFIIGEVQHVGPVLLSAHMTPLEAIATAGGVTPFANAKHIYILRTVSGTQQKIPFNYKQALKGDSHQDIQLLPGDTIVIP